MFITIQFPLFDNRLLTNDPTRSLEPDWLEPHAKSGVRYFGEIMNRENKYLGPWDGEKMYCRANSVFNFCGVKEGHYHTILRNTPLQSRVIFRRFQSDGKCMAKFEIGFDDQIENTLRANKPAPEQAREILISHLQKYITVPVKIKVGNKLSIYTPLLDAGNELRAAYYWATTTGPKSFKIKDVAQKVENFDPRMIVHVDRGVFDLSAFSADKIDLPELAQEGIEVYALMVPYFVQNRKYHVKTWLIATYRSLSANAIQPADFQYYSSSIRHLRINLLRINIESILQKRLVSRITDPERRINITDPKTRETVFHYIHKIFFNLSEIKRNKQPQQQLINAAFKLEEIYEKADSLDERIAGLQVALDWLNTKPANEANTQVIYSMQKTQAELVVKAAKPSVFISYNHNDQSTAFLLRDSLEKAGIDVILDSDDMLAGTNIEKFITDSVRSSGKTVMVASRKSLLSGWVGMEVIQSMYAAELSGTNKIVVCYLDESFMDRKFVRSGVAEIDVTLAEFNDEIAERFKLNIGSTDIDGQKKRLLNLRNNLSSIVAMISERLAIDVRTEKFDEGLKKLLQSL